MALLAMSRRAQRPESPGSHDWSGKAERGSETLIRLIVWLARAAGRPLCRLLLHPIVMYFWATDRTARHASREFLQAARGRPPRAPDVYRHLHTFAATLLDRVYMAAGEFDRFEVEIVGRALVDRALAQGRGCVLLGSHLGSFDLMMLAQRAFDGRAIKIVMRVDPRSRARRIAGIDDGSIEVIQTGRPDSYLRAHEALTQGAIVGFLADRIEGDAPRLATRFLGHTIELPLAPHVLAARAQAPVLMCFGLYEGGNRYRIEFVDAGEPAAPRARGAQLQGVIDGYASRLQAQAQRYPDNWFNFYRYWREDAGGNTADGEDGDDGDVAGADERRRTPS